MASRIDKRKTLRPVHPNAGIAADFRRRLVQLIDEMHNSVMYWVRAAYRKVEPVVVVQDATVTDNLVRRIRLLGKQWLSRFDTMAEALAEYFAQSVSKRSSATLQRILREGGFSVRFRMTPAMRAIHRATVEASVGLIKSIPAQYLGKVEGMVMRSVQTGRDLAQLTKDLQTLPGVTRRRATFIARDQNNKATAAFTRARQLEVGIEDAIWLHSHGGNEPRPTHLAAGKAKVKYKVAEGWHDPDPRVNRKIQPGELINCRCVSRSVIPGLA